MEAILNSIVFTLGVFLGVFAPETDPAIGLRAYRNARTVYVSADVRDAAGPGFRRLVDAGEPVGVELVVEFRTGAVHVERRWSRSIRRDIVSGVYTVQRTEDGKEFATTMREAALELLFRFTALDLVSVDDFAGGVSADDGSAGGGLAGSGLELMASASLFFPENGAEDRDLVALWNYKRPAARLSYARFEELPF